MKRQYYRMILPLVFALACNAVTQALNPATPTPLPSATASPTPIYVPEACAGVALATVPAATELAQPTLGAAPNEEITGAVQLRVFDELVSTVKKYYLYPDYNGVDWPALAATARKKVQAGMDSAAFYEALSALIEDLGDEHSHFESPKQVEASDARLSGSTDYVGIGVLVQPEPDQGRVTILTVFPDSPAEHGGLKPHDSILKVDGLPIVHDGRADIQMVRGPQCSAVVLTVQSPGGEPRERSFVRTRITTPQPIDATLLPTADGSRVGYIFLPSFFDESIPGQVEAALDNFGTLDGLILDNRMNGGGSSGVVEPILSFFTSGTLGHFVSRTEQRPLKVIANPVQNSQEVPLVVLVGEDTVSFGEIFSGLLKDLDRAKLAGETTLGNVETLHGYNFEDGSRLWLAEERFAPLNSDANWEKDGILPDVQAPGDWASFTLETDPGVAAALKLLGH